MPDSEQLLEIAGALTRANSEDELLTELAFRLADVGHANGCDVLLTDQYENLVLRATTCAPEYNARVKLGKGVGLCGLVATSGKPMFIPKGADSHPSFAKCPGIDDEGCEGMAVLPLCPDGPVEGVIALRYREAQQFTSARKNRLEEFAVVTGQIVAGFRKAYLAGASTNRLGALSELTKTIASSPYVEEILQLLVNLTAQQFGYRVVSIRLLDETRGELVLRATQAPAKAYQHKPAIRLGESIAGRAIAENRPIIVPDVQTEPEYIGHDLAVEQGLRSMICVPLTLQSRPLGVMSCYTSEPHQFTADEIKALETLAKQAAVSIEHAKLQVRSTLMQEMHHRVKNNLQQVASLLRLQLRHGRYKSLEEAINDSLGRILAIASVHDLLSREDLDHVGLRSIAETLVQHQQHSLMLPDRQIRFDVRGDDVHLNMTQATQVALVLNELIQNAVEHGFHHTEKGEIHVNIEERSGEVALWVSNSGDPLPPSFDPTIASHLGLQIVENLARALGGKFKIANILGWTVAEVKFQRAGSE